jgi:glycosyltransferase involved in cell wall biosynthesis
MKEPLVSIFLPSYNYSRYIGITIQSVLDQTYQNWELFIYDDCSSDNSVEIILSFRDKRIRLVVSKTNQGAPYQHNQAIILMKGKYMGSVGADDYFAPDKLAKQVAFLEAHPEIDIVGTYVNQIDGAGKLVCGDTQRWFNHDLDVNLPENWAFQNRVCRPSALFRSGLVEKVGEFNTELRYVPDYDHWLRCLVNGAKFHILKEPLTYYRIHDSNLSLTGNNEVRLTEVMYLMAVYWGKYVVSIGQNLLLRQKFNEVFDNRFWNDISPEVEAKLIYGLLNYREAPNRFGDFVNFINNPPVYFSEFIYPLLSEYRAKTHWLYQHYLNHPKEASSD